MTNCPLFVQILYVKGLSIMKKTKKVVSASLGLVTLMLVGSAFTAPLDIGKSESNINKGVVTKKAARIQKNNLNKDVKQPKATKDQAKKVKVAEATTVQKQANQTSSSANSSYLAKFQSISPSKVKTAASDQQQAAQLIQSETGITSEKAQKAASELFNNSEFTDIRNDLSSGNWLSAYVQYQKLSNSGALKQLEQSVNQ